MHRRAWSCSARNQKVTVMNRKHQDARGGGLSVAASLPTNPHLVACGPVLVVMDMQPGFTAAQDAITKWFVKQEVTRAREEGRPIVIVEYDPHEMGETFDDIRALVEGYELAVIITKGDDDGSAEILHICEKKGFPIASFRMCGVNSDACLLESIQGLADKLPECSITVVQDACNCLTGKTNDVWYEDYPAIKQVTVELHGLH